MKTLWESINLLIDRRSTAILKYFFSRQPHSTSILLQQIQPIDNIVNANDYHITNCLRIFYEKISKISIPYVCYRSHYRVLYFGGGGKCLLLPETHVDRTDVYSIYRREWHQGQYGACQKGNARAAATGRKEQPGRSGVHC